MFKKCEICGCDDSILIIKHHIHSRSLGGNNNPSNIANICVSCHEKVHHGLIIIECRANPKFDNFLVFRNWNESWIIKEKLEPIWLYPNAQIHKLKNIEN